ncbi:MULTISPECIES: sensor histidine kinase [Vibrio]|uniref:sensor histidine kinase n=1 Tax=Vibrio TaxID=662 RepID=UPI0001B93C1A|nr:MULTISPECIES: HAMP domain-containing sensor histidine kinase [Vibrio]EEX32405.1 probable two-component sensor [Vibrio coralliilyticus ATCC BAA-450]MCM5508086.1 HAMP domain-containing histidine kinase [Vibrio sp. SCSIO 43169]MDE3897636.1 HAMP domain-containing histidine kinase [Vibrio sp. CC007]QFT39298.1 Sensor protein QseC [Vibrio sp. THAF64]QGM36164.1 Sensor protein QseC [Vibrio sp. THAF191d]
MTRVSIKRDIYLYLFGIVISLTAIYGLMINQSYQTGLYEAAKYGFLYELKAAESEYLKSGQLPQSQSSTLQVYLDFNQVPQKFLTAFDWNSFENDAIYERYIPATDAASGEYLYAAYHHIPSIDATLYVVSQYDESIYLELFELNPPESVSQFNSAFIMIGGLLLLVFLIIRLLIYRLTKPILVLSQWSETLDLNQTEKLERFRYREVDLLANQLVESVRNERDAIDREEFFLRAASHELRTPVSIMSASGEMLGRLSDSMPRGGQRAVARIQRSVATMQTLITTLLWMSRNTQTELEASRVNFNHLASEIIESHRYLIESKDISVELDASSDSLQTQVPLALIQIVLNNLVRNAFQHSADGIVHIELSEEHITISNPVELSDSQQSTETSFGIGLALIEKVCRNQGWHFIHQQKDDTYLAKVDLQKEYES